MNIVYLTTHVEDSDFATFCVKAERKPNPAGQNFHGKMIRCIAASQRVHVFSLVPASLGYLGKEGIRISDNLLYSYIYAPKNKYVRALVFPKRLAKLIRKAIGNQQALIVYDSLNYLCAKTAALLCKGGKHKRIAILTDDPKNITGTNATYESRLMKQNHGADGSIALTQGLVEAFGLYGKPSFIQPIYVEPSPDVEPYEYARPYVYYGGALFEKDGTKDLLDAFAELNLSYDLVLAGHGQYAPKVEEASVNSPHIHYCGQVDKKTHYSLIKGAAIVINPRHYRKELDDCAVPSKVMEYLTYGKVIISTLSTPIKNAFPKDINWYEGDLKEFLKANVDANGGLSGLKENHAQKRVEELYGLKKSAKDLQRFLANF